MCVRTVNYKQTRQVNPRTQTHQSHIKANAHKEIDEILFNPRIQILNVLFVLKSALLNCSKQAIKAFLNVFYNPHRTGIMSLLRGFALGIADMGDGESP